MPNIEISKEIKERLEKFKKESGSKTYNEAIRELLWIAKKRPKNNQNF